MKKSFLFLWLSMMTIAVFCQTPAFNHDTVFNLLLTRDTTLTPFNGLSTTGLGISGNIVLNSDSSFIRIIVKSPQEEEFLVYEIYPMISDTSVFAFTNECEESCFFDGFTPVYLIIQITDAFLTIEKISWSDIQYGNAQALQIQAKIEKTA